VVCFSLPVCQRVAVVREREKRLRSCERLMGGEGYGALRSCERLVGGEGCGELRRFLRVAPRGSTSSEMRNMFSSV
jgi:hypothetical protein